MPVQDFSNTLEFIIASKYGKVMILMYDFLTLDIHRCHATSTLCLSKLLRNIGTCMLDFLTDFNTISLL